MDLQCTSIHAGVPNSHHARVNELQGLHSSECLWPASVGTVLEGEEALADRVRVGHSPIVQDCEVTHPPALEGR